MAAEKDFDIAIIGGGISGLTLAIALHHRGLRVQIYEQAPHFGEIGAGVAFTGNAVQAMRHCHHGVYAAFERVRTGNLWPSKRKVWFDYHDGYHRSQPAASSTEGEGEETEEETFAFSIRNDLGQAGVHRARYLDELVKLLPAEKAVFGKRLEKLEERGRENAKDERRWRLWFHDGTHADADAVIGCDGIKSQVRAWMFGAESRYAHPTYTHKYAYRALAEMEDAVRAIGEEKAYNACMHMGPGGHMLTFPVNHGKTLNIVAFHTTEDDWPDYTRLTRPATREDALRDFQGYGHDVRSLLQLCQPNLDIWAIFHLGDNPLPHYNHSSVLLIGDAAHATSPHHGAGAGMCIEDSAVLADLLHACCTRADLPAAFQTFNDLRRDRGNWLVQTSRHIGDCYEWMADGVGDDFARIEAEINTRNGMIADVSVEGMCERAKEVLAARVQGDGTRGRL
ncbi:Salicylate hydroxylase [Lecanosticta acicola]|uniref:Salicylate hydroxylase n=1 Tax=Lecanosticta acicola TaxID=111012 RepID=A0AAI8YSD6_9PEZI|nr:Salicylate hydroxylase [Lecanosticta acicola]